MPSKRHVASWVSRSELTELDAIPINSSAPYRPRSIGGTAIRARESLANGEGLAVNGCEAKPADGFLVRWGRVTFVHL